MEIEDLGSRFGTFVNDNPIRRVILKAGDIVRFGSSPPYRFDGEILRPDFDAVGMSLTLDQVRVEIKGRRLVEAVNFTVASGSFVAVLGPSGSGKSLLLECMSSARRPTAGQLLFDEGKPVQDHLEDYRSKVGVVPQDDNVYRSLTVDENLRFAARLRRPRLGQKELSDLVDKTVAGVGLAPDRRKRVAVLSGGQRKRVSIAIELLQKPRLLLLDEPASGLDPGTQADLLDILRDLARKGTTVVCSTHTMDTLHAFDSVVVLCVRDEVGSVAFNGSPGELFPSFGVHNAADLFEKLRGGMEPVREKTSSDASVEPVPEAETNRPFRRARRPMVMPQKPRVEGLHLMQQVGVVLLCSVLCLWRDRASRWLLFVQPAVLALLTVLSQFNQDGSAFIHFFLVVSALWLGMTLTIREIVRERGLYVRDRLSGLVPEAYLAGKALFAAVFVIVQVVLLYGVARLLIPVVLAGQHTAIPRSLLADVPVVWGGLVLMFVGAGGALIGLWASTMSRSERAAVALLPLLLLPHVLLSRVSYGDGSRSWTSPSPYIAITHITDKDNIREIDVRKGLLLLCSLPMITRPATAAIDMRSARDGGTALVAEWTHLGLLLMCHTLCLYVLFCWQEHTWLTSR